MPFETELSPEVAQLGRLDPVTVGPVTAAGDTVVLAAPGVGLRRRIFRIYLGNNQGATVIARLQESISGDNIVQAPLAANGGGVILDFGDGVTLADNEGLDVNLPAGGPFDMFVNVLEHSTVVA